MDVESPPTRGHKKKARTRQLLLDNAVRVLAEQGEGFSVAELAKRAGVSHGTFYNYFTDREELIDALVPHIVQVFAARSAAEVDAADPAERFAFITARALANGMRSPHIMRVVLRLEAVQRALLAEGPLSYLRQDLVDGHAAGRFSDPPDDGTLDVVLGTLLLATRRIVEGETGAEYRFTVIRRLLQALGVPRDEAAMLAGRAVAATPSRA